MNFKMMQQTKLNEVNRKRRKFKVRCKFCGKEQLIIITGHPVGKTKRCVYCGRIFCIHKNPLNSFIIREIK